MVSLLWHCSGLFELAKRGHFVLYYPVSNIPSLVFTKLRNYWFSFNEATKQNKASINKSPMQITQWVILFWQEDHTFIKQIKTKNNENKISNLSNEYFTQ